MNAVLQLISSQQEKIRKHWLICAISTCLVYPLVDFAWELFTQGMPTSSAELYFHLINQTLGLIIFALYFHCAYKKHGTRLLTWTLMLGVASLFTLTNLGGKFSLNLILPLCINAWWYLMSLKLRRVNKEIQFSTFHSSEAYLTAKESLDNATSLHDLKYRFHESISNQPNGFRSVLKPLYKTKKAELKN